MMTRLKGRIIGKTLTMPKQEDIILNSMTQAKEKWNSFALSSLHEGAMVFHIFSFIFLFRTNGKKNIWMETISVTVMVIISKVLL